MRAGTGLVVVLRCRICRSPARRPVPATSSSPSALRRAAATAQMPARRLSAVESSTLLQALEAVPDPRQRRGRRPPLHSMLCLALGAVLAGAASWAAIADWAAVTDHDVAVGRRSPHASTFRRLLGRVEVTALEAALTGWVLGRRDTAARQAAAAGGPVAERRMVLAADGKTLRGAHQPDGSQTKLFCLYEHACCLVLAQTPVLDGDEIAAFTTALAALPDLSGVVITADALHCQREHARWLHARGGHYLFPVKANQPTLRRAVALPWGQVSGFRRGQAGRRDAACGPNTTARRGGYDHVLALAVAELGESTPTPQELWWIALVM